MDRDRFELEDVVVERGGHRLLDGATGSISDHGVTVVAGPSGSGKSTLLRLLNRLEVATSGRVLERGVPIADGDPLAHRRRVGMVFQAPIALPGTVTENLLVARPDATPAQLREVLVRVGLDDLMTRMDDSAEDLSGGERQRLAIARTLLTDPEVVLFDEPTSALDPAATAQIEDLARDLDADGITSVWVTHDVEQLRRLAHHLVVVVDGRICQQGHRDDVLADPVDEVADLLAGRRR